MNDYITGVRDLFGGGAYQIFGLTVAGVIRGRGLFRGGAYSGAWVNRVNTIIY